MTFKLQAPVPTENDEAECLVKWAKFYRYASRPLTDFLVPPVNDAMGGVGTSTERAIRMGVIKRRGLRVGAADYFVAIPRPPFAGMWLELKRTAGGVVSDAQRDFLLLMDSMGYFTCVAYGWDAARIAIEGYLNK